MSDNEREARDFILMIGFRQFSIDDTSKPVYILVDSRKFKIDEIPITSMKSLASLSLSLIKSLP